MIDIPQKKVENLIPWRWGCENDVENLWKDVENSGVLVERLGKQCGKVGEKAGER
ncbi:MAG: hypothetical protein VKL39_14600 [Leptolyngbyaceae bacterium]|nr:hypothetical protein [Leptolyngbyaceae bacterium]